MSNKISPSKSLPPKDISPSQLWTELTSSPRAHRIVPFPRYKEDGESIGEIAMVVLTQEEINKANAAAMKYTREIMAKDGGGMPKADEHVDNSTASKIIFSNRASSEILFIACRDKDDINKRFFPARKEIDEHLVQDEISVLMNHYLRVQSELGPIVSNMSDGEMDNWIEVLAAGGGAFPLDLFSSEQLTTLILYMAKELTNLRKDNS